jgi:hypothetical protein
VSNHCLLYDLDRSIPNSLPKVLKDFFYNSHTTVVGVGIKEVAEKLEKERGLIIKRQVEL